MIPAMSAVAGVAKIRPGVPFLDQVGESADVVVVGVRNHDRVERSGIEWEDAIGARRIDSIRIEQTTVEQNTMRTDLQKMSTSRNLPGCSVKRDSQPKILLTIAPRMIGRGAGLEFEIAVIRIFILNGRRLRRPLRDAPLGRRRNPTSPQQLPISS